MRLWLLRIRARLLRRDERARIIDLGFEAAQRADFGGFFRTVDLVGGLADWDAQTLAWAALAYYDAGHTVEAERLLALALEKEPNDAMVLMCYGRHLLHERRLRESIEYLRKAVASQPENAWALGRLGDAYRCSADYEHAQQCYLEAMRHNPGEVDAGVLYSGLGHVAAQREEWDEAARCWREAASRLPRDEEVWYNLGDALLHAGQYREAIKALKKNLRLGSEQPDWTLYDMARCYQQLGNIDRAREFCERALEHAPGDEDARELKSELEKAPAG